MSVPCETVGHRWGWVVAGRAAGNLDPCGLSAAGMVARLGLQSARVGTIEASSRVLQAAVVVAPMRRATWRPADGVGERRAVQNPSRNDCV